MFNIRKIFNKEKNSLMKGVKVVYENGIVKSEILSWIKCLGIKDINDILINLGFKENDIVYLYQDYGNLFRVLYSVNEDKVDNNKTIKFNYKDREIVVSSENESKCYKINRLDDKDKSVDMSLVYCKKRVSDKISCFHKFGNKNSLFIIDNGDYELTLEIYLNIDNGYLLTEIIDCDCLEEYLTSLEFPIVIEEVYKNICDILELDQETMFEMFNLVVTKNVDKKRPDIVMDEILIQKGLLEHVTKTGDGKRITLDKDGNWSYDKLGNESVLTVKYHKDSKPKYRYSFNDNSDKKEGYFSEEGLSELKKDAKNEIEEVKKLVRVMFDN